MSNKNDNAWEKIFQKHNILRSIQQNGHIFINSRDINQFREARLMTKFDHKSQLPKLFVNNGLSILPISRGGYVIGTFETFHKFNEDDVEIIKVPFPSVLESLDYRYITSEATAINCAFVSNILSDFTGEDELFPTVSGRMSSSSFNFNINSSNGLFAVNVGNSQVEIDGGYEGKNSLNLIEAKNYISDDFLVRQLYYPYKLWRDKVNKTVRPIFLTYTNGVFHLREYAFTDVNHYNSLVLVKQKKYVVQDGAINLEAIDRIMYDVQSVEEPQVPFPQADSFDRVINLCELLYQKGSLSKEELTENYDFDARQTDYYTNAARYLGLLTTNTVNNQIVCLLTETGNNLFNLSIINRQIAFVKLILSHSVFKKTLRLYLDKGAVPSKKDIVILMKESHLYKIGKETTYYRRASTILGWINWIMDLIEE